MTTTQKSLAILGSTGSIGTQTLDVVRSFPDRFNVVGLTCNRSLKLLREQVDEFRPSYIHCNGTEAEKAPILAHGCVERELVDIVRDPDVDIVVTATVGDVAIGPTLTAIDAGKPIALANKETVVMAGELVTTRARARAVDLLPLDSEPNAIWQCILGESFPVSKLIITASGGALRNTPVEDLASVSPQQALKHPTWSMGRKITVDSATLMNKAFEVIEAHWLFGVPWDDIEIVIHPQSIIHSMVEFVDGSVKAQLSPPDMRLPIQYALAFPDRLPNPSIRRFDPIETGQLTFEPWNTGALSLLQYGYRLCQARRNVAGRAQRGQRRGSGGIPRRQDRVPRNRAGHQRRARWSPERRVPPSRRHNRGRKDRPRPRSGAGGCLKCFRSACRPGSSSSRCWHSWYSYTSLATSSPPRGSGSRSSSSDSDSLPACSGFRYGETLYSINAIPLGGFVRMLGEEDPTHERSFASQSVLKRAIVLTAGSLMNLAIPIVIFAVVATLPQEVPVGTVTVTGVAPGSPAAQAGIRPGDQVLSIDGERVRNHFDLIERTTVRLGAEVELALRRGSIVSGLGSSPESAVVETVRVVPRLNPPELTVVEVVIDPDSQVSLQEARRYNAELGVGDTMTQGAVGVMIGTVNVRLVKERQPVVESVPGAVGRTRDVLIMIKNTFQQWAVGGPNPGITGPIGIAQVTGEVARVGLFPFLELVALLSISLGIINLLPIPRARWRSPPIRRR